MDGGGQGAELVKGEFTHLRDKHLTDKLLQ